MITATHIVYYHLCHRKLWLFSNGIQMEHTSELVAEGKLIEETSYKQRAKKWEQLELPGIKIDYYDPKLEIIREVKKSNKREYAHIAQVKFYIFTLRNFGIPVKYGLIEYPKIKETEEVWLEENEYEEIKDWISKAEKIVEDANCPALLTDKGLCKRCSYYDFCYAEE